MEEEFIDIHHSAHEYELAVARLKGDAQVSQRNKELVMSFLRDAALGKTVLRKAKKKIGFSRMINYLKHLRPVIVFLRKDLDQVTQEDLERLVEALETDQIRSQSLRTNGHELVPSGARLSPGYKVDIKITIKKFYKWLWGKNESYPPIVAWIDTFLPMKLVSTLTEAEVERMIDRSKSTKQRALLQALFDGGFRLGEILNVRLKHVSLKYLDPHDPSKCCFIVDVHFSKTLARTIVLPMPATTKWLTLWLEDHPGMPYLRPDGQLEALDLRMQLFPMSETGARLMVRRAGEKALGKRVYPHLLRHASATFWSNRLAHFRLCKRFGWSMTSKMPQRYIDRDGVDDFALASQFLQSDRTKYRQETDMSGDQAHAGPNNLTLGPAYRPQIGHARKLAATWASTADTQIKANLRRRAQEPR
jgi:site-specific recombinase XerD